MTAIDTNILIYAFDAAYPKKRAIAKRIIEDIFAGKKAGVVTNQVLAEFATVITSKVEHPLARKDASAIIGAILSSRNWRVLTYTGKTVLSATGSKQPFWDALFIETLKENGVREIITENEKDFKGSGLTVRNPFS